MTIPPSIAHGVQQTQEWLKELWPPKARTFKARS